MESLLYLLLSSDMTGAGAAIEYPWGMDARSGVQVELFSRPSAGIAVHATTGANFADGYWRLGLGGSHFSHPFPVGGTKLNYTLSARIGYSFDDHGSLFLEYRHISNGSAIHKQTFDGNPGWDSLLIGAAFHL